MRSNPMGNPMRTEVSENDPLYHTANIKGMLRDVMEHVREDVGKVDDPKARALFETTAEVLHGLITAYNHYEAGTEQAWQ
jgi:hypothetical protein